ncbi:MAG TPA: hypothetical protein VK968_20650 [Roseimicrobium sp.]|nr:hypothetical protein [Roseimicrobium sp.]
MKRHLSLIAFLLTSLLLPAGEYKLGTRGTLNIDVPPKWSVMSKSLEGVEGFEMTVKSPGTNNIACKLTLYFKKKPEPENKNMVEAQFKAYLDPLLPYSVEKKPDVKDFTMKSGFGIYTSLTNARMVGKPKVKDKWKTITIGLIAMNDSLVAAAEIQSDDTKDPLFQQAIGMIQSMTVK